MVTSLAATLHWLVHDAGPSVLPAQQRQQVVAVEKRVKEALRQGPFGVGRTAPAQHLLETL